MHFMQKFKMASNNDRTMFFWQRVEDESVHTLWVKNFVEIALSRTVSEILQIFFILIIKKNVAFSQPFCIRSLPKANDF